MEYMKSTAYRMFNRHTAVCRAACRLSGCIRAVALAVTLLTLVSSCVEVEICDSDTHPHTAAVKFDYAWPNDAVIVRPDSMGVLAYRVVGRAKQLAKVDTRTLLVDGQENLPLPTGAYKFVTFPYVDDGFDYSEVKTFVNSTKRDTLQNIYISYIEYDRRNPELRHKPREWNGLTPGELDKLNGLDLDAWDDHNNYSGKYLQPDIDVLYLDTTQIVAVDRDTQQKITFSPYALTQDIGIYFDIEKVVKDAQFVIDNVWGEVSGVPRRINLCNGNIDISHTSRIMFPIVLTNATSGATTDKEGNSPDDGANTRLHCYGNINVPGIVNVQQRYGETLDDVRRKLRGPGIMQVIIYGHSVSAEGKVKRRRWQGIINLYEALSAAKLITITPDGLNAVLGSKKAEVRINTALRMDGKTILRDFTGDDGIEEWIPTGSISVDI